MREDMKRNRKLHLARGQMLITLLEPKINQRKDPILYKTDGSGQLNSKFVFKLAEDLYAEQPNLLMIQLAQFTEDVYFELRETFETFGEQQPLKMVLREYSREEKEVSKQYQV